MSIRLKVLVDFYLSSLGKLSVSDVKAIKDLIFSDIKNLLSEDNYNAGHNHGLMLDLSLLYCASSFKESGDFFDVKMVFDRASKTLSQMFNSSGFTKEHSIVYQPFNAALANELFDYAADFKQSELIEFIQKINNATDKLLAMAKLSDGHYLTVGDSFRKIDPSLIEKSIKNKTTKNKNSLNVDHDLLLDTKAGICLYSKKDNSCQIKLAFTSCWHSNAHKQNDELSFILEYNGICIFDDVGYTEFVTDKGREWHRSESVHSNFSVQAIEWSKRQKTDKNSLVTYAENNHNHLVVKGHHTRFASTPVERLLALDKERQTIYIKDSFFTLEKLGGVIETRFVLHPSISVNFNNNDIEFLSKGVCIARLTVQESKSKILEIKKERIDYVENNRSKVSSTDVIKILSECPESQSYDATYKIELISNNALTVRYDDEQSVGYNILNNNAWFTPRFGTVPFGPGVKIDWSLDPFSNRSWVWLFHQLAFIKDLLNYDKDDSSGKGLSFCLGVLKSWWENNKDVPFTSDVVWHDHGSALRLRRILDVFNQLSGARALTSDESGFFDCLIKKHADYLADEKFYSRGNNHGLDQTITLFLACVSFKEKNWAAEYLSLCTDRLRYEVERMFDGDGGHFENSCHYQGLGITQLLMVSNLLRKHRDVLSPESVVSQELIEKATKVLCFMVTPLGNFAPIGDTEASKPPIIFPDYSKPNNYSNYQFALSCGTEGKALKDNYMVLPESGWAFYRNTWKDKNDFYLLAKCGYKSDYHRQDDDTSFVLYYKGEEWITDGGLYNYQESDSDRKFIRSHHAHSMSAPVEKSPIRKNKLLKGESSLLGGINSDDFFYVKMKTNIFAGYKVARQLSVKNDLSLSIYDCVENEKNQGLTQYRTRFVVPVDKEILVHEDCIEIKKGSLSLRILILSDIAYDVGLSSISISRSFNELIDAQAVDINYFSSGLTVNYKCLWSL
ncbi:hypothetical protein C7I36_00620 [Zobellella taiwanensis]|uniref:Uncharacterized protein n=2 Tax=Zobellella taiwanensis TaxID=347535 RepID=A0A2P7RDS1_9GAMM|nr:hypothetical protein C7I36_00620 [Zobellella taiwanensis]